MEMAFLALVASTFEMVSSDAASMFPSLHRRDQHSAVWSKLSLSIKKTLVIGTWKFSSYVLLLPTPSTGWRWIPLTRWQTDEHHTTGVSWGQWMHRPLQENECAANTSFIFFLSVLFLWSCLSSLVALVPKMTTDVKVLPKPKSGLATFLGPLRSPKAKLTNALSWSWF